MSKRGGESLHRGKPIVKKRKGVKIRSTLILDSDEDDAPSNVNTGYVRWVKTRVAASGQVGNVTTSSVAFVDLEGTTEDPPLEVNTDEPALEVNTDEPAQGVSSEQTWDVDLQGIAPKIRGARRKQGKINDSVSFPLCLRSSTFLKANQTKMQSWLDVRPIVLDEMIRLDGPGDTRVDFCSSCLNRMASPVYRCLECSYGLLFCRECVIKSHQTMPLHRLEVCSFHTSTHLFSSHNPQCWRNGFFDRESLHSLGFVCHLGHGGAACPIDSPHHDLVVIDTNGWHKLRVIFCACGTGASQPDHYRQLLRIRWYPASFNRPRTAFSFDLLETYHKVTLQGKLNLYDFYLAIMHKSDNQGRSKPMVSELC